MRWLGILLTKGNTFQWLRLKINFYSQRSDKNVKNKIEKKYI